MQKKIILFELNEVPFKIIEQFCEWHPDSTFANVMGQSYTYETHTEDISSLSPWRTWPSLHRGVNDEKHMIYDFGQDLTEVDKQYTPVWEILTKHGISTGICGSLHTYPMPDDLEHYDFYLPDTFAAGSECFPNSLEAYQEFNLQMARRSARNVSSKIHWSSALDFLKSLPDLGFKLSTLADVGMQVVSERIQRWKIIRRRTYQSVLAFDIFMRQLSKNKPSFSTFFTNHVASSQHRYWAATFPSEYENNEFEDEWIKKYRSEIDFTMHKADQFLKRLVEFADKNPEYAVWVASSMGQEATEAKPLETQLYITNLPKFMAMLGLKEEQWSERPAMLPQYGLRIAEPQVGFFREQLNNISIAGEKLSFVKSEKGHFTLNLGQNNLYEQQDAVIFNGEEYSFNEMGLENVEIQDKSGCTAYHIPQGSLLIYDPKTSADKQQRTQVSTLDFAPTILNNFGVPVPDYMNKPVHLV